MTTITTTTLLAFTVLAFSYYTSTTNPRVLSVSIDPLVNIAADTRSTVGVARNDNAEVRDNEFPAISARLLQSVAANIAGENRNIATKLFDLLNGYRSAQGVSQLVWNETAYKIAVNQTAYMVARNRLVDDKFSYQNSGWKYITEYYASNANANDSNAAQNFYEIFINSTNNAPGLRNATVDQGAVSINYNASTRTYFTTIIYVTIQPPLVTSPPPPTVRPEYITPGEVISRSKNVLAFINQLRQDSNTGLSQLAWNDDAYNLAIAHAAYQANQKSLSSDGFNARAAGWQYYAEVVGAITGGDDGTIGLQLFDLWNNSPNTKGALTSSLVDGAGISVYYSKDDNTFYAILITVKGTRSTTQNNVNIEGENKQLSQQLFNLLNQYRATKGLGALIWNETAYAQALAHSKYQAQQGQLSSDNYSTRYRQWPRGYAEAVAYVVQGTDSNAAQQFVDTWSGYAQTNQVLTSTSVNQGTVATFYVKSTNTHYATLIYVKV